MRLEALAYAQTIVSYDFTCNHFSHLKVQLNTITIKFKICEFTIGFSFKHFPSHKVRSCIQQVIIYYYKVSLGW